ncbi:hypothetical protein D3C81_1056080 [compost metagenome]
MDADIPFHKVEARVIQETADGIRADIQTVNVVTIVTQQTFGQVIADKTVNAQDQHASSALHDCIRLGGQAHIGHDAHFLRQAAALHVQTGLVLPGNDFQRAVTASDDQRRGAKHCARLFIMLGIQHAGTPDDQLTLAEVAECARVRLGDRTDQVVDFLRGFMPQNFTVCGCAAAKIAGVGFILRSE